MRALILAAGKGTRYERQIPGPKALINFKGLRLIDFILKAFEKCNIDLHNVWMVVGFEKETLENIPVKFILNSSYEKTNMLASLYAARKLFDGSSDLIISYSDIIYEPRLLAKILNSTGKVVVASDVNWENLWKLRMENYNEDIESFILNENKELVSIGKKKPSKDEIMGQYIGLFKVSAQAQSNFIDEIYKCFADSPEKVSKSLNANLSITEFLQQLIDKSWTLNVVESENGWLEFDTKEDYDKYLGYNNLHILFDKSAFYD